MATYTKTIKGNGTTDWADGDAITHTEFNAEFDGLITDYNGNIDQNNISASAQILNSSLVDIDAAKVTDHADNDATFLTVKSPGDTGTTIKPTDLEEELEALRYRIGANKGNFSGLQYRNTGGSMVVAGWTEPPITGRNMFPNSGFEVQIGLANAAPDGWNKIGTPTRIAIDPAADPEAGVDKRSLNIVASGGSEGIARTVTGLKPSTKYLVGMEYTLTAGNIRLQTTNGLGSGDYQNLTFIDSSTSSAPEIFQGIVKTDTTPTDITVNIVSDANNDDFNIYKVWFYELSSDAPAELPHIPMQTKTYTTEDSTTNTGAGAWVTKTDLSLTQYVPFEGYRFIYEVLLCFESGDVGGSSTGMELAFRLRQKIDAANATTVEGPVAFTGELKGDTTDRHGGSIALKYIIENPTPGASYAFTVDVWTEGTASAVDVITFNPRLGVGNLATQSSARLYTERI